VKFKFRLHPVGVKGKIGLCVFQFSKPRVKEMLTMYSDWSATAPKNFSLFIWLEHSGIFFIGVYNGDTEQFSTTIQPFKDRNPESCTISIEDYSKVQSQFDEGNMPRCYYWSSSTFLPKLSEEIINVIYEEYVRLPEQTNMEILHLGGAVSEFPMESTPFTARNACHEIHTISNWEDPSEDFSDKRNWARGLVSRLSTHRIDVGGYVNFNLEENIENSFGKNFLRLQKMKTLYDPKNMFKFNHNIKPAHQ